MTRNVFRYRNVVGYFFFFLFGSFSTLPTALEPEIWRPPAAGNTCTFPQSDPARTDVGTSSNTGTIRGWRSETCQVHFLQGDQSH